MNNYRKRAQDIVDTMSVKEKTSQMVHEAKGISRLNIPAYNWWNEGLHGVGRAGIATVFPQSIGMAAMFDDELVHTIADAISDEARAKYNEMNLKLKERQSLLYKLPFSIGDKLLAMKLWYYGLTYWSPNVNLFRDPRWGRGHETYGEDPFLTSRLGVAFVKGLQGNHPDYLKVIATPKHFAVHSGPEKDRHHFNAVVNKKDLYETYLPAFKACVQEGKAASIMAAYNAVNGEPAASNAYLLQDILRDEWGFDGFVVSDCGGIRDIHKNHKTTTKPCESAVRAVKAGCDLNCGMVYHSLKKAVSKGAISEDIINKSLIRLFEARLKLGMFDSPAQGPYSSISSDVIDCTKHRELALESSRRSLVLLKNDKILPLDNTQKKIAVIGPNADKLSVLLANYNGTPSSHKTALQGIKSLFKGETVYTKGCDLAKGIKSDFENALNLTKQSDAVILCLGLAPEIEGEEGDAFNSDASGDKINIKIPGVQEELLMTLKETDTPIIVVLFSGSPLDLRKCDEHAAAVIQAWYPGQDGGQALAELIFGVYSPSGRLPVSFVHSDEDLPAFDDYSMKNRTYRYLETPPLYPFGYGLSYSTFSYEDLKLIEISDELNPHIRANVSVKNIGLVTATEAVQLYLKHNELELDVPNYQLCGFKSIKLLPGEEMNVEIIIPKSIFSIIDLDGNNHSPVKSCTVFAGGQQPDKRSEELTGQKVLKTKIVLT